MEGPTPVSALIHAATMVAAGVYLVGRAYPIFTPEVLLVIAFTGCITLFIAATIAITATDIKRVLAYSTVSQLGYMMLALGVGGWLAGIFHLFTHAFLGVAVPLFRPERLLFQGFHPGPVAVVQGSQSAARRVLLDRDGRGVDYGVLHVPSLVHDVRRSAA